MVSEQTSASSAPSLANCISLADIIVKCIGHLLTASSEVAVVQALKRDLLCRKRDRGDIVARDSNRDLALYSCVQHQRIDSYLYSTCSRTIMLKQQATLVELPMPRIRSCST